MSDKKPADKPVEMRYEDDSDEPSSELARFRLRMFIGCIITAALAIAYLLFLD